MRERGQGQGTIITEPERMEDGAHEVVCEFAMTKA